MRYKICLFVAIALVLYVSASAQKVGIGNNNPQEMLDVTGGVKLGYTSSANSQGTLRSTGDNVEFNNGFNWRGLVNYDYEAELSSLTPFTSTVRNAWQEIPASLTINTPGVYLIIYSVYGNDNTVSFPGSGNQDYPGTLQFRLNGNTLNFYPRYFTMQQNSWTGTANRIDYTSLPVEYSTVQTVTAGTVLKTFAQVSSVGTVSGSWTIYEAKFIAIRLN